MSSSYHPQTDGSSERTNKTVIQALQFHVSRHQKDWVRSLPKVRFDIMSSVNASTGLAPFQLHIGCLPRLIPPLLQTTTPDSPDDPIARASALLESFSVDTHTAHDNLTTAKIAQAMAAAPHRGKELRYEVNDLVMLSTMHRRRDYIRKGNKRVAKFMVRYDGPYKVLRMYPDASVYTLDLPSTMRIFPTFHASLLKPFKPNDDSLFPGRAHPKLGPIITENGEEEWEVEEIIDRRRRSVGYQYLVRWKGWGPDTDSWLPGREVEELAALDRFLKTIHD
ncbi:hypothetical protein NLI96_g12422 [Meripilus lineatus]|uniref:Chromo domain-containing protein n=1 Tax=Meripilus lineatus TaxID=2056292 RepID=A0AAD5UQ48_9APHY|nr:hypothetical protein NLI96_g12422 [Physisporinus lineatus]